MSEGELASEAWFYEKFLRHKQRVASGEIEKLKSESYTFSDGEHWSPVYPVDSIRDSVGVSAERFIEGLSNTQDPAGEEILHQKAVEENSQHPERDERRDGAKLFRQASSLEKCYCDGVLVCQRCFDEW